MLRQLKIYFNVESLLIGQLISHRQIPFNCSEQSIQKIILQNFRTCVCAFTIRGQKNTCARDAVSVTREGVSHFKEYFCAVAVRGFRCLLSVTGSQAAVACMR